MIAMLTTAGEGVQSRIGPLVLSQRHGMKEQGSSQIVIFSPEPPSYGDWPDEVLRRCLPVFLVFPKS